ncbi:uncharacterized protein LOC144437771 [Glandiceps talaboti]
MTENSKRVRYDVAGVKNDRNRTILIVNDEWGTAKGGVSTVHRQVAKLAKDCKLDVYVTALEASNDDVRDIEKNGIRIILPNKSKCKKDENPTPRWLNCHESYFPHLRDEIQQLDLLVGHIPITNDAVLGMRNRIFKDSRVIMFNHIIPEDTDVHKVTGTAEKVEIKENNNLETAKEVNVMVSVGPRMKDHNENKYRALSEQPEHIEFIPRPDQKFFDVKIKKPKTIYALQVIAFGRVKGVEKLKGYDIVAEAMVRVTRSFRAVQRPIPTLVIRGVPENESADSKAFFEKYRSGGKLKVVMKPYGTQDEIRTDLQQSHLCIMASRSEPFGLVGFEAMATGLPTLVTVNSGLAEFLKETEESSIYANNVIVEVGQGDDITSWEKAIRDVLCDYNVAFDKAQKLKEVLESSDAIKKSLEDFKHILMD